MEAVCGVPPIVDTFAGVPLRLVIAKLAVWPKPLTDAITLYEPAVPLAVKVDAVVATPEALVVAVMLERLPAKVPLAPVAGAANDTVTFGTAFPLASFTVAENAVANAWPTAALCGVPPVAVMDAAGPGLLVSAKFA